MITYITNETYVHGLDLVKTDKNGSKYYVDHKCPKCGGTGNLPYYGYVLNGVCFKCGGTGKFDSMMVLRTEEYTANLQAKYEAKQRKLAPELNKTFCKSNGFNEEGNTWMVLGNTFEIKDELKAKGAKFNYVLGWHFDSEVAEYDTVMFSAQELLSFNNFGRIINYSNNVVEIVKSKRDEYEVSNKLVTNHFGNIGNKIARQMKCTGSFLVKDFYGSSYINKLVDEDGNVFIWKTGRSLEGTMTIKGTIKEHNEYHGEKQTVLTRCYALQV